MNTEQDVLGIGFMRREEIIDSCRVVKAHASGIGVAALEIAHMPGPMTPKCLDEMDEAAGVLRRALDRIERAKDVMAMKPLRLEAAE